MNDKQKAILSILLLSILSGSTAAVIKIGLVSIPPLSFAFLRFLIAGVIILPFLLKKKIIKSIWSLVPLSLLGTINIVVFILGVKRTTATIAQLLYAGVPLLTALIIFIFLKERLDFRKAFGISIGFLGVVFVVLLPIFEKGTKFSGDLFGNLLIAIGVISWSFYTVFSKDKLKSFSPFVMTATFILITLLILLPLSIFESIQYANWWKTLSLSSVFSLIYVGTVSTIFTYLLNQYAIKHGGSIFASMQFYLIPISAYLFAFLLLGEGLTKGLVAGGLLALLGVYITTKK